MQQIFQDENGDFWMEDGQGGHVEVDANGAPVSQGPVTVGQVDPGFQYEGQKAAADVRKSNIQADVAASTAPYAAPQAAADLAKTNSDLNTSQTKAATAALELEEARKEAEKKSSGKSQGNQEQIFRINESLANLSDLEALLKSTNMATGGVVGQEDFRKGDAFFGASSFLNQDANDAFGHANMVIGDLINQVRGEQAEQGNALGSKNSDTPTEAARLAASIANVDVTQDESLVIAQIERARDYYNRRLETMVGRIKAEGGEVPDVSEIWLERGGAMPDKTRSILGVDNRPNAIKSASAGDAQLEQATGERYSTPEDKAYTKEHQDTINNGGTLRDLVAVAAKYGREPDAAQSQEWARALDYRDGKGEFEGQGPGMERTIKPTQSGVRSVAGQVFGDFARTDIGETAIGFGIGGANAAALGGLDEIVGGVNSVVRGTDMDAEIAYANMAKQNSMDASPWASALGALTAGGIVGGATAKVAPNAAQALAGSARRAAGTGAAIGSVSGALEDNDNRAGGAMIGAGAGMVGGAVGQKVLGPGIERLVRSDAMQAVSGAARSGINRLRPNTVAPNGGVPNMPKGEAMLPQGDALQGAIQNLEDARRLGVPYSLADASPELRQLAGSVSRKSPEARALAEEVYEPRGRGQADRLVSTIDQRLAPTTDINARKADITKAGGIASEPYYNRAYAVPAPNDPVLNSILETGSGKKALKEAYNLAGDQRRDPSQLGFIYDEATGGVSINQAGRYQRVTPEGNNLESTTLRGYNGNQVQKKGPVDLVGYLRLNGGLKDNGGELANMGLTNAPRRGMDHVGKEAEFGPLVNDQGMNFDDAAMAAWEAGYFPELNRRPDINEFLDGMRQTQEGTRRRFLAEDQPIVDDFEMRRSQNYEIGEANRTGGLYNDTSQAAGPREFAPTDAYGKEVGLPTYETMHFARQGMDDVLNKSKNPVTGQLDLNNQGRALAGLRKDFAGRLGELNPDFAEGNRIYSNFAKRRDALDEGFNILPRSNVPERDFDAALGRAQAYDNDFTQEADRLVPEMQRGFATKMADQADKMRMTANPFESVYGSPLHQSKVGKLFPEGAADFDRTYNLERDMAKTQQELLGGSPTASRMAADEQFDGAAMMAMDAGVDMAVTGGLNPRTWMQAASRLGKDNFKVGFSQDKSRAIAPTLFEPSPDVTLDYLEGAMMRQNMLADRKNAFRRRGGLFGASAPLVFAGSE